MKKLQLILAFVVGIGLASCTDNEKKEQVNDETKEIDAQSHSMEEGLEEQNAGEDKDLEVDIDTENKKLGVETEDVDVNLKGDDDGGDNKNDGDQQ